MVCGDFFGKIAIPNCSGTPNKASRTMTVWSPSKKTGGRGGFEGVGSNITLLLHRGHSVMSGRILVVN